MLRQATLSLAIGLAALALGSSNVRAQGQAFDDYANYAAELSFEGYVYALNAQYLAATTGYYGSELALGTYWSQQSAYFGYYGQEYGYLDWIEYARDSSASAYTELWAGFDVLYFEIYPDYPSNRLVSAFNYAYYGGAYAFYAEIYYDLALEVAAIEKDPDADDGQDPEEGEEPAEDPR